MKIKICGLTSVADALAAAEAGADWVGLNFHPGSPRRVEVDVARRIIEALPASCEAVGVFVDRPAVEVAALAEWLDLKILQLHGSEPVEDLAYYAGFRVVKAFGVGELATLERARDYAHRAAAAGRPLHAVLLDAFAPAVHGGSGTLIRSDLIDAIRGVTGTLPRLILAGGLTPANVAERVARVRPWMVDAASGVESQPVGHKDATKMVAFVRAVRAVSQGGMTP